MSGADWADKKAAELLPCDCDGFLFVDGKPQESHTIICPSVHRPAVAAALREAVADQSRQIAVVGGCDCGIAYISHVDSIDSGSTYRCEAGHAIVFDVWRPDERSRFYKTYEDQRAEIERLRNFARDIFAQSDWPDGNGVEGWDLQSIAARYGLLTKTEVKEPCGENCWCADYHGDMSGGVTCYRKVSWLVTGQAEIDKEG